jgi:MoaA/NifB/PqqE/SkfB family radical SAM enzyme
MAASTTGGWFRAGELLAFSGLVARYLLELRARGLTGRRDTRLELAAAGLRRLRKLPWGRGGAADGPEIATLAITPRCPLDCLHCSTGDRRGEPLPRETVLDVIDRLLGMGTHLIALTGGEPFLSEHLVEYVERVPPPTVVLIFSSGSVTDEAALRRLSGRSNLLVVVSVDNLEPAVHDRQRGRDGSWRRAMDTLESLRRHGIEREVSTLVTGERIRSGELERFLREMRRAGIASAQIFQPRPVGRLAGDEDWLLTAGEEAWMADLAGRSLSDRRLPLLLDYPYVESAGVLGCCGGTYRLYVDRGGEVCPCDFCPISFGNVSEEPLEGIWRRMRDRIGHPGRECLVRANREAVAGLEAGAKLTCAELEHGGGLRVGEPAAAFERHGDRGYRFLLRYLHFTSSMYPRLDRRFDGRLAGREA